MKIIILMVVVSILLSCDRSDKPIDINLQKCFEKISVITEKVTELSCRNMGIVSLVGISKYENINTLDMTNNQISDISALQSLGELTNVYLAGNPVSGYSTIESLPKIKWLTMSSFDDTDIEDISSIDSIEYLTVEGTELSNVMLKKMENLPNLFHLGFVATKMKTFPDLSGFPSLTWLSILDEDSLEAMGNIKLLSDLNYLLISAINIHDISYISNFTKLQYLTIANIEELKIELVENLSELERISLVFTKLTGDISKLVDMESLSTVLIANVPNIPCEDIQILENEFGNIYFIGLDESTQSCVP